MHYAIMYDGQASRPEGSSNTPSHFMPGILIMDKHLIQGGVVILLVTSCRVF